MKRNKTSRSDRAGRLRSRSRRRRTGFFGPTSTTRTRTRRSGGCWSRAPGRARASPRRPPTSGSVWRRPTARCCSWTPTSGGPTLNTIFRQPATPGLSSYLAGDALLDAVIQKTSVPNLSLVASGPTPPNPAELLGSRRMREFLAAVGERFDLVLLDSPPVLAVSDVGSLCTWWMACCWWSGAGRSRGWRFGGRRKRSRLSGGGSSGRSSTASTPSAHGYSPAVLRHLASYYASGESSHDGARPRLRRGGGDHPGPAGRAVPVRRRPAVGPGGLETSWRSRAVGSPAALRRRAERTAHPPSLAGPCDARAGSESRSLSRGSA